jgi:D-alanine-D-alanine ligase
MKIGLVYDLRRQYLAEGYGKSDVVEFDSDSTIDALEAAVRACGHETERIGHARALAARLVAGRRWDLVFTVAEGLHGRNREAQVPCLCELYNVPYTFSDAMVCAATLDKSVAKRLVAAAGLRTPRFAVISERDGHELQLAYPLFAKPLCEGTGKGIDAKSRIDSPGRLSAVCADLLERFRQPVLVEEYLPGREFTTGILGSEARARVVGTMEIVILPGAPARDYSCEVKEECEEYVDYRPMARGVLREEVESLSLAAYRLLECRDAGRVDVRLDKAGRPAFLELNPLPGLHPTHSDLPMIAAQAGTAYRDLIGAIIESASRRIELSDSGAGISWLPRHSPGEES